MAWCWARRPPGSAVLPGALAGQGQEELRGGEASSGEGAGDRTRHLLGFSSLDHGDRGAAEAASGHAGSMCTGPTGCLDGDIELVDGHLVVVTQRIVRGVQESSQLSHEIGRASCREREYC